ncbi:uncharacterized protein [Amphiura filiformis]|uniref:uncharacterized protein n=1 Tax=Amphiura filiformis TaxID=82378 RepID=UPI003B21CC2F
MASLAIRRNSLGVFMRKFRNCRPIATSSGMAPVMLGRKKHVLYKCNAGLPFMQTCLSHIYMKDHETSMLVCTLPWSSVRRYSDMQQKQNHRFGTKRKQDTNMAKQSDITMPKHHTDKLQLSFDDDDLAELLVDTKNLLNTDSFKRAGVTGKEAETMLENLVKYLCFCQCSPGNILHTIESNPDIMHTPWHSLQTVILLLEEIGLRRGQLLKALNEHKPLWGMESGTIRKRLGQLRQIGFNDDLKKAVAKWPQILTISGKQLNKVFEALKQCDFSRQEIKTIIADHPWVLSDSPHDIVVRFQYVHFCMGITEGKELVHGKIFRYPLDHTRSRHILLERMGIFRTPDKHKIDSAKNPQLQMIIDTTDARFCSKVAAGISVEDFEVFKRNLKDELKEMGMDDAVDDDGYISHDYESDEYSDDDDDGDEEEYSDSDEDEPKTRYRR